MQELYRVLKPGGMAILQIPQDLSRAATFADDSITDQKERSEIFSIRPRSHLWTRLF
jgi:ubiquinone/menaquinone biosynthesis C-methylase UbiE